MTKTKKYRGKKKKSVISSSLRIPDPYLLGKHVYNWLTLLYTWNQQNIVNQLYSNKKKF